MTWRRLLQICIVQLVALAPLVLSDWTKQCSRCECIWVSSKRTANCTHRDFVEIPKNLSSDIRAIDFSHNQIYSLDQYVFDAANLRDVHKLKLQHCLLVTVHRLTFNNLGLLIELDLSYNNLTDLVAGTFAGNLKLRILAIHHNRLRHIQSALFTNMTYLQRIMLNNNEIDSVAADAFDATLMSLQHIDLAGNRLTTIGLDVIRHLPKLNSLNLENNHWMCDCHLEAFRNRTIRENLVTIATECTEPARLRGRTWQETNVMFACSPRILQPIQKRTQLQQYTGSNVTLACRITGSSQSDVYWLVNGRVIDEKEMPSQPQSRLVTTKEVMPLSEDDVVFTMWYNVSIINVNYRDRGEYKCMARNPAGTDERIIQLVLNGSGGGASGGDGTIAIDDTMIYNQTLPLIIGLSCGITMLFIAVFVLVWCCCGHRSILGGSALGLKGKKKGRRDLMNACHSSDDECINLHHGGSGCGGQQELEKALITDVNPVMKPPRVVCSVPPSINNNNHINNNHHHHHTGGSITEISDLKKNLLDSDSVFAEEEESRSQHSEVLPTTLQRSLPLLDGGAVGSTPTAANSKHQPSPYPPDLLPFPPRICQVSPTTSTASTATVAAMDAVRLPALHGPQSPNACLIPYDTTSLYRTLPYSRSFSPFGGGVQLAAARVPRHGGGYVTIPRRPRQSWSSADYSPSVCGGSILANDEQHQLEPLYDNLGLRTTADGSSILSLHTIGTTNSDVLGSTVTPPMTKPTLASSVSTNLYNNNINNNGAMRKLPPLPPPKPKKRTILNGPLFEDEGEDGTEV